MGVAFWCGDDDLAIIGDEGVEFAHQPVEGVAGEEWFEDGEGVGDDGKEAVDAIADLAGGFVDERNFVYGALAVDDGAGVFGHLLVGSAAFWVEDVLIGSAVLGLDHARGGERLGILVA